MNDLTKKGLAEFLGTFILVFCGTGAIVINEISGGAVTHLGISITFGLVVTAMIYSFGELSGAHINPAVSIAFYLSKSFPGKWVPVYILSQLGGAILASLVLRILFPNATTLGETLPANGIWQTFVLEVLLSFILMLVIFRVAQGSKEVGMMAGLAIGLVVLFEALFAGPISGASMNPARSLGPALVNGTVTNLWIYPTATTLGMALAVPVRNLFLPAKHP